jgi:hypothetical protein
MSIGRPIQVSRPATLGGDVQRYRQDGTANKDIQDDATLAWNFFTALYYKADGIPWRLVRDSSTLDTCFVGVSFYEARDGETFRPAWPMSSTSEERVSSSAAVRRESRGTTAHPTWKRTMPPSF